MLFKKTDTDIFIACIGFAIALCTACPLNTLEITFIGAVQDGGISDLADTTALNLTFSADPVTLNADDITVTGAAKGTLSGTGPTRTLALSNITVGNGETISVAIASPNGYSISGSPQTAVVYKDSRIAVAFDSAVQNGGADGTVDTVSITLTFSVDPETLTADDIGITGATKGTLSGTGTTRTLAISGITAGNAETVSVTISNPSGYKITNGSTQTAVVYRYLYVGMAYKGGKIAYILQSGDPGFVSGQTHGFIASIDDFNNIRWSESGNTQTAYGTALGTGQSNTAAIMTIFVGSAFAAGLCDNYINTDTGTGVYSDWYLPSKDELNKLYLNKAAIGGFADAPYWSSSEDTGDAWNVWSQNFSDGIQSCVETFEWSGRHVRAVRSF